MDYFKGEPCEQCESTNYCIVDAIKVCENGHEQGEGQIVGEDEDDFGTQGRVVRKKVQKVKNKRFKVYRGSRAYRLYIQAYQFVLWKQCYALIHGKSFPPELWVVVRDLWALRLSKLLHRLEASQPVDSESQALSSDLGNGDSGAQESRMRASRGADSLKLVETLALCYMGILLLRLPIGLCELYRWVKEEDVLYVRAIQGVPIDMKEKLPGEYHKALDTPVMLQPEHLHEAVSDLATLYRQSFGLALPQLNHEVLLYKYIFSLALPLEIFPAVQGLARMTRSEFRYSPERESRRRQSSAFPEMQLMSLLVIAVKLLYPFDRMQRHPRSIQEPGAQVMDWMSWEKQRQYSARPSPEAGLPRGSEIDVQDIDVFKMSQREMDSYMDWYQKTWVKEDRPGSDDSANKELLNMFPVTSLNPPVDEAPLRREQELETAATKKAQNTTRSMQLQEALTDEELAGQQATVNRPGEGYRSYRSEEELPERAKGFFIAAAETACTSVKKLISAVLQSEARIATWKRARRRAEVSGQELDLDSEMRGGIDQSQETRLLQVMEAMDIQEKLVSVQSEESAGESSDADMEKMES